MLTQSTCRPVGNFSHNLVLACFIAAVICSAALEAVAAPKKLNWRQQERLISNQNAARQDRGGRISIEILNKESGVNRGTAPESVIDGSAHSRCVFWGSYKYKIELIDKLPVTKINFICSDGKGEASPKDIVIKLSDGTVIEKTLEVIRPQRNRSMDPARQSVEVGKKISWVEVTVLTSHPGEIEKKSGKPRMWGGLGEIEVITSADLKPYLIVPGYNAKAPVYIQGASPRNDYSDVEVAMPEIIPLGTRPGIYLTADEISEMYAKAKVDPRAAEMLKKLFAECDKWLDKEIIHPDPTKPAQLTDRGCPQAHAHDLLAKMSGWLGWAYRLSGDQRYAEKAREILVGYAKLYPNDYKEHRGVNGQDSSKVMAQRLSEAMWILPLIQSYDMVADSECFTDAERELVERDLIRHCVRFINRKQSAASVVASRDRSDPNWRTSIPKQANTTVGNWSNFYHAAYIQAGIVLGDQDWIDIGFAATKNMIAKGIGDDGMWGEGAIGYRQFARQALVACIEPLARKGLDAWGFMDCRFKNLFDSPMKYAYPDGTAPGINDSGRASVASGWTAMAYDYGYLRYNDPNYGVLVNAAPRQVYQSSACYFPTVIYEKQPEELMQGFSSMVFENLGYGILRGSQDENQTYLLMDYGRHGGTHGHLDKLNLILYADGDELAGEPQFFRYEDARHAEWTKTSIAHWTMSVDENMQVPATGKLLCFADNGDVKIMRGVCDKAYTGVGLDRTAIQMDGYFVDIYKGWGSVEHVFDYPLCFRGSLDVLDGVKDKRLSPAGTPTQKGYKHIMSIRPKATGDNWSGHWQRAEGDANPSNDVKVIVVGEEGSKIYFGRVPGDRDQVFIRRKAAGTVFAAVIDPFKSTDAVKLVERFDIDGPVDAYGLKVLRSDGLTDLVIVRFDPQTDSKFAAASSFAGGATDALVSVITINENGQPVSMGFVGGSKLVYNDQVLMAVDNATAFSK